MDSYWQAVVDHLSQAGEGARIVGPVEFGPDVKLAGGYANMSAEDAAGTDALILHKGRYRELDGAYLRDALATLTPSFANEVFIVLTRGGSKELAEDAHLDPLREISAWAHVQAQGTAPAAESPPRRLRIPATYLGNGEVLVEDAFGHLLTLSGTDRSILPHMIRDGYFDLSMTQFLRRRLRPGMTYVDVGANFGVYAVLAAEAVGARGRVVAVEANPRIAAILQENLAMNGFEGRSTVLRTAAGAAAGTATMYEFGRRHGGNTLMRGIAEQATADYGEVITPIEVPVETLTGIMTDTQVHTADLMKIDVEGFELDVLQGARDFLAAVRPDVVLEWHPRFMSAERAGQVYRLLADALGYSIRRISENGVTAPTDLAELMTLEHADIVGSRTGVD